MKQVSLLKRIKTANRLRESGEWEDYLDIARDKPCHVIKKYRAGDVVKAHGAGIVQQQDYVYIGSYRSSGRYGMYLLLNKFGKVVKHDNICFPSEVAEKTYKVNADRPIVPKPAPSVTSVKTQTNIGVRAFFNCDSTNQRCFDGVILYECKSGLVQAVEITKDSQFDAGIVRTVAPDKGHIINIISKGDAGIRTILQNTNELLRSDTQSRLGYGMCLNVNTRAKEIIENKLWAE